jgi:hypothetical protein
VKPSNGPIRISGISLDKMDDSSLDEILIETRRTKSITMGGKNILK